MEPEGKYSIELFKPDGEGAGLEEILDRHDNLTIARAILPGARRCPTAGPADPWAVRSGTGFGPQRSARNDALTRALIDGAACAPNLVAALGVQRIKSRCKFARTFE